MRLADFIEHEMDAILSRWDEFAETLLPSARRPDHDVLRDHAEQILKAISTDLRTAQTLEEQKRKSRGQAPVLPIQTAAQTHALLRAASGFDIRQLVSEYRALRASVLLQYLERDPDPMQVVDIGRFNEAIDQALAESVDYFTTEVDRWRNVFLGVLGHDLRGPLNAIAMASKLLLQTSPDAEQRKVIERLHNNGQRMTELLDDLLDFTRVNIEGRLRINARPADMVEICRQEIELYGEAHPSAVIEFTGDDSCPGVWDSSRIRQALGNLIHNAISHGKGGPVRVSVRSAGQQVAIDVENEGPALSRHDAESIFNPLVRGSGANDNERRHLGLGLFVVRQTAEAHGGSVDVRSEDGRTCFSMLLPMTATTSST